MDELVELRATGERESDICCRVSGRLARLSGAKVLVPADRGEASSNLSRTTVLGSTLGLRRLDLVAGLPNLDLDDCPMKCPPRAGLAMYSGSSAKLSGVMTTLYVPGRVATALRSRSSSFVRAAKAGR